MSLIVFHISLIIYEIMARTIEIRRGGECHRKNFFNAVSLN